MARFQIQYRGVNGHQSSTEVEADSFPSALSRVHQLIPEIVVETIRLLDNTATVQLKCVQCKAETTTKLEWGDQLYAFACCPKCDSSLRFSRVRKVVAPAPPSQLASTILGESPIQTTEHDREPSQADWVRAKIFSPDLVRWNCRACKWEIECEFHDRGIIHACPECGVQQYVPASSFAWNSRVQASRARERVRLEQEHTARQNHLAQQQMARERAANRLAQDEETQRRAQATATVQRLRDDMIGAGVVGSADEFRNLTLENLRGLQILSNLADELRNDLLAALDENALAEKAVAYGRPTAAGASVVSLLAGYGWAGLAFGAIAVSARWMSKDWKKAQVAEYQAKWTRIFSGFDRQTFEVFTRVFTYKYPMLAQQASLLPRATP